MKLLAKGLVVLGFALTSLAAQAQSITVKKGTDVPLLFDQKMSSKTAKVGDKIKLKLARDVVVNGHTLLRKGTPVTGVISKVEKKDHFGKNASLKMTLNPVKSLAGEMITLQPREKGHELKGSKTDKAAIASGGGAILLGPLGLIGGYFITGKTVNVKPGDKLMTEVAKDTVVSW